MKTRSWLSGVVMCGVVLAIAPSAAHAEMYSEAYNGAVCIPYPAFSTSAGVPYQHWLYGFSNSAFCHFPVPNGWAVSQLSYVLFEGTSPSNAPVRVRLCVSSFSSFAVTCGAEATLQGNAAINWVALPALPSNAATAFLSISFPSGVSTIQHFYPVWFR
jgi:hypothetical protein